MWKIAQKKKTATDAKYVSTVQPGITDEECRPASKHCNCGVSTVSSTDATTHLSLNNIGHAPTCRVTFALFSHWGKVRKPPLELLLQQVLESAAGPRTGRISWRPPRGTGMPTFCSTVRCNEPCPGENLEDSQKNHDLELECRPSAHQRAAKNLVTTTTAELDSRRSARQKEKNSVLGGDFDDQKGHEMLDCQIGLMNPNFATSSRGTSTHCSAVCGSLGTVREQRDDDEILGTAITCSGIGVSRCKSVATIWSTPCGTGMSRIWTMGTTSASCSMVRCWSCSSGHGGSPRQGGREPPGSSSYKLKSTGWRGGGFCRRGASFLSSCPSSPALAVFCPRSVFTSDLARWPNSSMHLRSCARPAL